MSYTEPLIVELGEDYAGLSDITAELFNTSFVSQGTQTGFTETSTGTYFKNITIPDDFNGYIEVYSAATSATILGTESISNTIQDNNEKLTAIYSNPGVFAQTLNIYITSTTTGIPYVKYKILLSSNLITFGTADINGQISVSLDGGTYSLYLQAPGYTFSTPKTLTVTTDATHTFYGGDATEGLPVDADQCEVYEYVRDINSDTIPSSINAYAFITSLPYDSDDQYFSGEPTLASYNSTTGRLSWVFVRGVTVQFRLPLQYKVDGSAEIPDQASIRLADLLAS
jgi:hypothetical protein